MKFISMFVAAIAASTSVVGAAESDSRNLLTLAEKWNITDPTFDYDSLSFDLDYQVSSWIDESNLKGEFKYEIYDSDCKDTGVLLEKEGGVTTTALTVAKSLTPNTAHSALTEAEQETLTRIAQLNITIAPDAIADNTDLYEERTVGGERFAIIDFCVRFSLWTTGNSPVEVNFLETIVTLNVDLTDGFDIGTINVSPKERLVKTANQAYEVEAYQCNSALAKLSETEKAVTRNQGSIIRVCVWPTADARADGIYMREIQSFEFTRDFDDGVGPKGDASGETATQLAIVNSNEAGNGLTTLNCGAGYTICMFETILFADFYHVAGTVTGTGVASMQFGGSISRRQLRGEGDRNLQDDEVAGVAEFDMNFETVAAADDAGIASAGNTVTMLLAVVVSGATAVLMM